MAVVLLLAMVGIVGAPTKVEALSDGSISGTVTGAQGEPISGAFIGLTDSFGGFIAQTFTDPAGHYSLSQLPTGEPVNLFVAPDFNSPYPVKSINGIVLAAAESRVLDVQLSLASSVSGHVSTVDGAAVNGSIALHEVNTGAQSGGSIIDGDFSVFNVPAGTWVAYAVSGAAPGDPYAPEYFGGGYSLADATPFVVADGVQVTGIDITLDVGATLSGQVFDDQGVPATSAFVDIPFLNGPPGSFAFQGRASVSANGSYSFVGLPPGTFTLFAALDPTAGLGRSRLPVTIALGDALTGVDIHLQRGMFGTVQVVDASGPVPPGQAGPFPVVCDIGAPVSDPFDLCGRSGMENAVPDPNGPGWILGPLAEGDYSLQALTGNSIGASTTLHVTAGGSFSCTLPLPGVATPAECIAAAAPATGSVSGRVVGEDGLGIAGVVVYAWVGSPRQAQLPTRTFTDASGDYVLPGVFVGDVQLQFSPPSSRLDLLPAWWSAAGSVAAQAEAGVVAVTTAATTSGIDATLRSLAHGDITLTRAGAAIVSGFGLSATICASPSVFLLSTFRCSDGVQPISVGNNNSLPLPHVRLEAGDYNVQSFSSLNGLSTGAPARLVVTGGDEFSCTLPVDGVGTPTCLVNGVLPDSTPPVIDGQLTPSIPDGDNGWWRGDVTVHWTVSEPESPGSLVTDGCQDLSVTADTTGVQTLCSATSAGGSAGPAQLLVRRDATPPSVVWFSGPADGQSYPVGQVPSPFCFAQDATSGPNGCEVAGWSDQPGTHTLTATAHDMAGNTATETRTYTVNIPYTLKGFYAPVRMDSVNRVSDGSEVDLRFEVFNGATEVRDPAVVRSFTATPVSCSTGVIAGPSIDVLGGRAPRYDTRKGVFSTEWKVPKRSRGCIDVTVTVDGTSLTAHFRVR